MQFESQSPEATLAFANHLGSKVRDGDVIALSGDLGAGKTTFVRGLALGMGIEDPVSSPTYTLMHHYQGSGLDLFHYDAWMEGRQKAWIAEGGAGVLETGGVTVIEWAGRVADRLPSGVLEMELKHLGPESRAVILGGSLSDWERLLEGLPAIRDWRRLPD